MANPNRNTISCQTCWAAPMIIVHTLERMVLSARIKILYKGTNIWNPRDLHDNFLFLKAFTCCNDQIVLLSVCNRHSKQKWNWDQPEFSIRSLVRCNSTDGCRCCPWTGLAVGILPDRNSRTFPCCVNAYDNERFQKELFGSSPGVEHFQWGFSRSHGNSG